MKTLQLTLVLGAMAGLYAGVASAGGDIVAGAAKAKAVCAACHGDNGDKPLLPEYPLLSGQHQDYLVRALKDYKSGARKNAIMGAQAQTLSAKDIENVAAWFASRPGSLGVKR